MFSALRKLFKRNPQTQARTRHLSMAKRRERLLRQEPEHDVPLVCRICAHNGGCMVGISHYPKHGFGPPSALLTGSFVVNTDTPEGCPLLYPDTPFCRVFPGAYREREKEHEEEFPDAS